MLMGKGISHRMRYGAQIAMALIMLFACSPFSVYIIYVLRDLWGPMLILIAIRVILCCGVVRCFVLCCYVLCCVVLCCVVSCCVVICCRD